MGGESGALFAGPGGFERRTNGEGRTLKEKVSSAYSDSEGAGVVVERFGEEGLSGYRESNRDLRY